MANKSGADVVNIEAGPHASVGAIAKIDNSANSSSQVTYQYANIVSLLFAAFANANCTRDFNLTVPKTILLGITTSFYF